MKWDFIKNLAQLIAVGNPSVELLQAAFTLNPAHTLIFALDEQQTKRFKTQFTGQQGVDVKNQALSVSEQISELYQYNLPDLNALSPATAALNELFPGLKLVQKTEIATGDIANEFHSLSIIGQQNVLLLADPAQNLQLLKHLASTELLSHFVAIVIQHCATPFYQTAATLEQLQQFLAQQGLELAQTDTSDPDFPIMQFFYDAKAVELKKVYQQLAAAQQEASTQQQLADKQVMELTTQLTVLKQQLDTLQHVEHEKAGLSSQLALAKQEVTTHQQRLEALQAEFNTKLTVLKQQLEMSQQQADQERSALQQQLTTLQQQAEQEKTAFQQQLATLKQQAEQDKAGFTSQLAKAQQQAEQDKAGFTSQLAKAQQQAEQDKTGLNNQLTKLQEQAAQEQAQLARQLAEAQQAATNEIAQLSKQLADATQKAATEKQLAAENEQKAKQKINELEKTLAESQEKLTKVTSWFEARKKQALELEEQLTAAKVEIDVLKGQQVTQATMQQLQASMQQLFANQASQLQQAANALGQHITRSQHEQQSSLQHYLGLQHYLQTGEPALNPDSWAIAADTLSELVTLLNSNNYDVIIEFGSGQSTTVIAKTLAHQNTELQQVVNSSRLAHKGRKSATTELSTEHFVKDLPARIVSFEQAETYLNKTRHQLNEHGLAQFVELVLAPLVPANYANQLGTEPLFYNCNDKLAELAKVLAHRQARILVVVDGPSSPTQDPLIRYAALPAILNNLAAHKLQIVLDDTKREGEQQVLKHWQHLCEQRGLQTKLTAWPTQKGAVVLDVTP